MEFEAKKEYLKGYRVLQAKIARLMNMINECPENYERLNAEAEKTREKRDKIESTIEKIDGGVLSEILFQKYILGKSMEQIGYAINYSKRQVERLHLKAVNLLPV